MREAKLSVSPAAHDDAAFIEQAYRENLQALHGTPISLEEWQGLLTSDDPDERHFVLRDDSEPCAWLKFNGLEGDETGWISMLAVLPAWQRKGVGTAAMAFAEEYLRGIGKQHVALHTTGDNLPALSLYRSAGFEIIAREDCRWDDGALLPDITLMKDL